MMKRINYLLFFLIAFSNMCLLQAQEQKNPNFDINIRGGIGKMVVPTSAVNPYVSDASLTVSGWLSDHWAVGLECSLMQMTLNQGSSSVHPKDYLLNQLFVGPSISLNKRSGVFDKWGIAGYLSLGYTCLLKADIQDPVMAKAYDSFTKAQHGFGLNLNTEVRRYIGKYYLGLGYRLSSRMIKVGSASESTSVNAGIGTPQLVFGLSL